MSEAFDPYYKWLGIPPADQPPHHYRLLAIELFEADSDVIAGAADQRMAHIRSFRRANTPTSRRRFSTRFRRPGCVCSRRQKRASMMPHAPSWKRNASRTLRKLRRSKTPTGLQSTLASMLPVSRFAEGPPGCQGLFRKSQSAGQSRGSLAGGLTRKRSSWLLPAAVAASLVVAVGLAALVVGRLLDSSGQHKELGRADGNTPSPKAEIPHPQPAKIEQPKPQPPAPLPPKTVPAEIKPPEAPPAKAESPEQAEKRLEDALDKASSPADFQAVAKDALNAGAGGGRASARSCRGTGQACLAGRKKGER